MKASLAALCFILGAGASLTPAYPLAFAGILAALAATILLSRKPALLVFSAAAVILTLLPLRRENLESAPMPASGFYRGTLTITSYPEPSSDGLTRMKSGRIFITAPATDQPLYPGCRVLLTGTTRVIPDSAGARTFFAHEINLQQPGPLPLRLAAEMRRHSGDKITRLQNPSLRALLYAMILGNDRFLGYSVNESFRLTGLTHLLAISGLNVAVVGMALMGLFLLFIPRKISWALASAGVLVYAALAGLPAPATRAALLFIILSGFRLTSRQADFTDTLGICALITLVFAPLQLREASFWLSYLAVGGLYLLSTPLAEAIRFLPSQIRGLLSATLAANLATLPLLVFLFKGTSLLSPLANLLVLPLFELLSVILFALFAALMVLPPQLVNTAFIIFEPFWKLCTLLADWLSLFPWAYTNLPGLGWAGMIASYSLLALVIFGIPAVRTRLAISQKL